MTELAPTQQEAPFLMTQLLCLAIFVALGRSAVRSFHELGGFNSV